MSYLLNSKEKKQRKKHPASSCTKLQGTCFILALCDINAFKMKYSLLTFILNVLIFTMINGQTLCDGTLPNDSIQIFVIVESMPEPSFSESQLENILNASINLKQYGLTDGTSIYLGFIVNCRGDDFYYKVLRPVNDSFEKKLISEVQYNMTWKNGNQRGIPVDVALTYSIIVENGLLNILDKEEIDSFLNFYNR